MNQTTSSTHDQLAWMKSTYSDGAGNNCVEVAVSASVHIRDSKQNGSDTEALLSVPGSAWMTFIQAVRA